MKKATLSILLISLIALFGCQLKENYAMQSSFSNEAITKTSLEVKDKNLSLEMPFADFSCDIKSFKPVLSRDNEVFTIILEGSETVDRCPQKFSAEITGLKPGDYWLKVIYRKAGQDREVFYQPFNIAK